MEHYHLEPNEVLLFQAPTAQPDCQLLLTNLYAALICPAEDPAVTRFPVSDIKIYKEQPQLFLKNRSVEFFLTTGEMTVEFRNRLDASRFMDAALELLTGKSRLARNAGKVKKALDDVSEAFGVNLLEEARNFSVDTVSRIVSESKPSLTKLLPGKKKKEKAKAAKKE